MTEQSAEVRFALLERAHSELSQDFLDLQKGTKDQLQRLEIKIDSLTKGQNTGRSMQVAILGSLLGGALLLILNILVEFSQAPKP